MTSAKNFSDQTIFEEIEGIESFHIEQVQLFGVFLEVFVIVGITNE